MNNIQLGSKLIIYKTKYDRKWDYIMANSVQGWKASRTYHYKNLYDIMQFIKEHDHRLLEDLENFFTGVSAEEFRQFIIKEPRVIALLKSQNITFDRYYIGVPKRFSWKTQDLLDLKEVTEFNL